MANQSRRLPGLHFQAGGQSVQPDRQRSGRDSVLLVGQRALKRVEPLLRATIEPASADRGGSTGDQQLRNKQSAEYHGLGAFGQS